GRTRLCVIPVQLIEMAKHRPESRWALVDVGRQRQQTARILLWRRGWGSVENQRWRRYLEAGHGWTDQKLVGRGRRGSSIEPGRRLHRHGRDATARQHHARRWRLQIDRCGQDLEARRLG